MIVETLAALLVMVSVLVPGIMLSMAMLFRTTASKFDKVMIGAILGMFVPPVLSFVEYLFFGVDMSAGIALANAAIMFVVALAAYYYQAKKLPQVKFTWKEEYLSESHILKFLNSNKTMILLVLVIAFGFYARYATSASTYFSEIDPYYYMHETQLLITQGHVPLVNGDSYFPQMKFQRNPPLMNYMVAGWFQIYQAVTGSSYSNELLTAITQFYPPLVGALLSYLGFLLVSQETDRRIALVAAGLFAFTPQLIQKLAAGVSELQPLGLFATVMIFTFTMVAIKQKSLRWGLLAGFATLVTILGSNESIWPLMAISAYVVIAPMLDFLSGEIDSKMIFTAVFIAVSAVVCSMLLAIYTANSIFSLPNSVILFIGACIPSLVLFAISKFYFSKKFLHSDSKEARDAKLIVFAGLAVLMLAIFAFTPVGDKLVSYVNYTLSFSKPSSAIMMTVAEEAPASDAFDLSSYGFFHGLLSPSILLMFSAVLCFALMLLEAWKKKRKDIVMISLAIFVVVFVFNSQFDMVVTALADKIDLAQTAQYVASNDMFYYMMLALASTAGAYLLADKPNKLPMMMLLIFFPISFIGLSKLKYIAHLATALPIAVAFTLFMLWEFFDLALPVHAETLFSRKNIHNAILSLGFLLCFFQFAYAVGSPMQPACSDSDWGKTLNGFTSTLAIPFYQAPSSVGQLCYSRLDSDWIDAMTWMRMNLGPNDRVESWWDYGHWTTFIAGKNTVLDPGNAYPEYNQETARALVDGPESELVRVMNYHGATYIMLDSELIQKWGALNFLGGTFSGLYREPNPASDYNVTPAIDWQNGPGKSKWELEHSFEFLYSVFTLDPASGQAQHASCPGTIPRQMLYSGLTGSLYCISTGATGTNLFALTSAGGDQIILKSPQLVQIGSDTQVSLSPLSQGSSYYINTANGYSPLLLNLNPDFGTLTNGTMESKLYNSPYVKLYFGENLPGFTLEHKTPNGRVKIFKLTG